MNSFNGLGVGLGGLPLITGARTRSVSAENPTGKKGMGGMATPEPSNPALPHSHHAVDLGKGWKVRPFEPIPAGKTTTIMDVEGPGIIQHIWMAMVVGEDIKRFGRANILRVYWDDEEAPSIETPITDFFAVGHDIFAPVNSLAVVNNPKTGMNCY